LELLAENLHQVNSLSSASPHEKKPSDSTDDKALILTFWLMLLVALWSLSLSWNAPILDRHDFRQLQTAVSAHWLKQDGFRLDYETPLFGPPSWSIPMEFPVYQWCVARLSSLTGLALDQSGRTTSIFFLLATLPAVCALAGLGGLRRPARLLVAATVLSSPVYLFYGRAFMIETTALCFATWFVVATARSVRDLSWRWAIAAMICGSLAALAKVTTFAVYCFPAAGVALWLGWPRWKNRGQPGSGFWSALFLCSAPVVIAATLGRWWVRHADAVKDANPFSGFLKSSEMASWNWGTLDQRFSLTVWNEAWSNIRQFVLSEPSAVILLICCALTAASIRRFAAAGALAFLMGPILFANLYYRHDYYYSANAVLLLISAGLLLAGMWESSTFPKAAKRVVLVLFFGSQLLAFYRGYGFNHRRELPQPPGIASVIRDVVPPDGVVLIYGWDWDSLIPYYSQRRAIMVPGGRETELGVLEDIVRQLPPRQIGALLIKQRTPTPFAPEFIQERLKRFDLSTAPIATSPDGDLYLRNGATLSAAGKLKSSGYAHTKLNQPGSNTANPEQLQNDELGALDFSMVSPQPSKARSKFGIKVGENDGKRVIFAHPISELYFTPPTGTSQIEAEFGIVEAAYAAGGNASTDGVGFEIYELRPDGLRRTLFHRELDPAHVAADRGRQTLSITGLGPFAGSIIFKTTPGLKDNLVNDWAYWSGITLK
jgi:hypothetical protein